MKHDKRPRYFVYRTIGSSDNLLFPEIVSEELLSKDKAEYLAKFVQQFETFCQTGYQTFVGCIDTDVMMSLRLDVIK